MTSVCLGSNSRRDEYKCLPPESVAPRNHKRQLVTADGDILKQRKALASFGVRVMTDTEAVELVEGWIREQDVEARDEATATALFGNSEPASSGVPSVLAKRL